MDDRQEIRRRLETELRRTVTRLRELGGPVPVDHTIAGLEGDSAFDVFDQADVIETRESHFATRERLIARLEQLRQALERLAAGTYGICTECEQPISPARLRAIPEATTCVPCQERLERERAQRPADEIVIA